MIGLAFFKISIPAIIVGLIIPGIDFQGLGVIGDGSVILAFFEVSIPAIVVCIMIRGIDLQGLIEIGDSLVIPAFYTLLFALIKEKL